MTAKFATILVRRTTTDAISRKDRIKPKRVRAMNMTIQSSIKNRILAAQKETSRLVNSHTRMLRGLDKHMERRSDGALYYLDRIWVPLMGDAIAEFLSELEEKHSLREYTSMASVL
ncbi:hypothetical protein Tco_0918844 [Tanacetum coccineum]